MSMAGRAPAGSTTRAGASGDGRPHRTRHHWTSRWSRNRRNWCPDARHGLTAGPRHRSEPPADACARTARTGSDEAYNSGEGVKSTSAGVAGPVSNRVSLDAVRLPPVGALPETGAVPGIPARCKFGASSLTRGSTASRRRLKIQTAAARPVSRAKITRILSMPPP